MGTSKSYIPPTNGEWTKAKRAVTRMVNGSVSDGLPNAVRKYASAVRTDDSFAEEFSKAVSSLLGISRGIRVNGLNRTLEEYEKEYLIGKKYGKNYTMSMLPEVQQKKNRWQAMLCQRHSRT